MAKRPARPKLTQPGLQDAPIQSTTDRNQQQWQSQMTQAMRTGLGQSKDQSGKFLTWDDLESQGIVEQAPGSGSGGSGSTGGSGYVPGTGQTPEEDRNPPPVPQNVSADGAMTCIYITWTDPKLSYDYRVEIHRSAIDDLGTATLSGSGIGTIYQDVVGSDKTVYYYWIRFVKQLTNDIIIGPWNKTAGTPGQASEDAEWVLEQISGKFDTEDLKTQVFSVDLFGVKSTDPDVEMMAFAVDTTVDPPMVAMNGASIVTASINDAQIGNLNVDKLIGGTADFVEANILEGTITNAKIGEVIQSTNYQSQIDGWIINKNGFAEFGNAYFRGTIDASIINGGEINGAEINGGTITGGTIIGSAIYSSDHILLADPWGDGRVTYYDHNPDVPVSVDDQVSLTIGNDDYNETVYNYLQAANTTRIYPIPIASAGYADGVITRSRYRNELCKNEKEMVGNDPLDFYWALTDPRHNNMAVYCRLAIVDPMTNAIRTQSDEYLAYVDGDDDRSFYNEIPFNGSVWLLTPGHNGYPSGDFPFSGTFPFMVPEFETFRFGSPTDDSFNGYLAMVVRSTNSVYVHMRDLVVDNTISP